PPIRSSSASNQSVEPFSLAPNALAGMPTGTTPSASETSALTQETVATRCGAAVISVSAEAWVVVRGKAPSRSMPAAPSDRSSSPTAPVEQPANTASRENSAARTQGSPRPVERVGDSATPAWVRTAGAVMGSPLRGIRLRLGLPHIRRNSIALTAVRASAPKRCRRPLAPHGDSYHPGVDKVRLALLRFAGTDIPEMAGAHVNDPLLTRHSRGA